MNGNGDSSAGGFDPGRVPEIDAEYDAWCEERRTDYHEHLESLPADYQPEAIALGPDPELPF